MAEHSSHRDAPVPGGRVSPETGAAGTASGDVLTPEERRELERRLARPDGPRDDAGRAPDPGDLPGEADDVRAAFGTAGADAADGGAQGQGGQGYGGMGGDGTTQSGILSAPGGSEAAPTRVDDVPASERSNPEELAGRDDARRNPPRRDETGPGGRTVFSNAAREG
ncbi:SclB protein [Methylobacterium terricola]|uniref:SclB protein n=1 Tax=Methylobacterium terricola TaxID=2583531 RepID=A0A5C4LNF4_9HYPH|nr:SclB protein [Methylobacterium terricola]TNC15908.1 SclB protein [Methylobacterium terricola]